MNKPTRSRLNIGGASQEDEKPAREDRVGKKLTGFFMPDAAKLQLKEISLYESKSIQELMVEAVNLLFQSRNKPPIA